MFSIMCVCVCVQRKVTRLPAPYGSCMDPASADATMNAYADFYPVKYTPSVSQLVSRHILLIKRGISLTNL